MPERWIAFDVETPNSRGDRMSAIGVTVVEHGAITGEFCSLVDPETYFETFHMALTGITPERVEGWPAFPELWERLRPMMEGGVLAAHNAPFDLAVLSRCLRDYGIRWQQEVPYVCTCRMGRKLLPEVPNHRLNTLCRCLGLELDHHNAGSDSRACAELLRYYLRKGADPEPFLRRYDLLQGKTVPR